MALRIAELRIKLKSVRVTLIELTDVYCDSQLFVKNKIVPGSKLNKNQRSINYHVVHKAAEARILRVGKGDTATNLADPLTNLMPYWRKN